MVLCCTASPRKPLGFLWPENLSLNVIKGVAGPLAGKLVSILCQKRVEKTLLFQNTSLLNSYLEGHNFPPTCIIERGYFEKIVLKFSEKC